ncbi:MULTISPECIES: class I SAM-dependent methyltransferase [Streptococcus]|uniref:tRNA (Cmo5U34)-methyltransferase n=1 Tax=Streptococcus downei MFe28 TaxID=764290 RepID=A0A380JGE8_STRDO|nr:MULTISPECIES: class I SAM-dependent methyltransferase [Streptococcus]EFQ58230.1 putative tRNA (cmo5U34)-methyltransferase [Streptococcus downei F0415]OZV22945.1 hypothetical protein RO09_00190 [Streptococcus sobrinus]SUN37393.1 tRNA (cmo5U34)-methyltransferase [Streptococcus downei MFe28]
MDVGNDIDINDSHQWTFYNGVAKHFDNHVKLSVPLYEEGHEFICYLSDFFLKEGSNYYEVGSSTGTLINKLCERHDSKKNVTFYGVEPVKEMIDLAQKKCDKEIKFVNDTIENVNLLPASLIVGYL